MKIKESFFEQGPGFYAGLIASLGGPPSLKGDVWDNISIKKRGRHLIFRYHKPTETTGLTLEFLFYISMAGHGIIGIMNEWLGTTLTNHPVPYFLDQNTYVSYLRQFNWLESEATPVEAIVGPFTNHESKVIRLEASVLGEDGTYGWVTQKVWKPYTDREMARLLVVDEVRQHKVRVNEGLFCQEVRGDSPSDLKDNDLIRIDIDSGPVASYEPLVGIKAEDKLSLGKNQSGPFTLKIKRSFIIVFQDDDYGIKLEFEGDLGVAAKKAFESDWENVSVFTGEGVEVEWKDWLEVVI